MKSTDKLVTALAAFASGVVGAINTVSDGTPEGESPFEAFFASRRTAVDYAQDKKAALKKEKAALAKEQKKLNKKIQKQRQKQAEKIYKQRIAKGYDASLAAMDEAAAQNASDRRAAAVKKLAGESTILAKAKAEADAREAARIKAAK